ncbi:GNAT family N-acetyltransferase [Limisalsivibrio acetivorans]|uniref:GNAT family N-acetyltransferase n=1 Tax=Limisalsivibrio acetivorans TaxID=1304888 RepID=UPI0003B468D9|nr:GNAT family N-acetyltransferase [Limisalsivibrio acetivorans]
MITVDEMGPCEAENVSELIQKVFKEEVAPLFPEERWGEFLSQSPSHEILSRLEEDSRMFVAVDGDDIVGAAELKKPSHISLIYSARKGEGVGSALLNKIEEESEGEELAIVATENSKGFFEKHGFVPAQEAKDGCVLMKKSLATGS